MYALFIVSSSPSIVNKSYESNTTYVQFCTAEAAKFLNLYIVIQWKM